MPAVTSVHGVSGARELDARAQIIKQNSNIIGY